MVGTSESGNPNPNEATRFKAGNIPAPHKPNSPKPWSIANMLRKVACEEVDGKARARIVAESTFAEAEKGNISAAQFLTERLDGKMPQTTVNADFEKIKGMTDDELRADVAARLAAITGSIDDAPGNGETGPDTQTVGSPAAPDTGAEV